MAIFINKLRYFTLFLCLIFSIYSINFYEGSKILFLLYNLTLILLTYFLTNISSSFFSFFLGFYLFMGFWFKYNLSLVFNDGYVFDSGLMKSSNIDNVLILSIYIFITIIVANQISKPFKYNKFEIQNKKNLISNKYFKFKYLFILLFIATALFTGLINYIFKIYIKGLIFENNYDFIFTSFLKWLLLFGLTTVGCYILNKEIINRNKYLFLFILLIFLEMLISYTSMLSRSILLFGLPFIYSFVFYNINDIKMLRDHILLIIIFALFSVVSIYLSNHLRLYHVDKLKSEVKKEYNLAVKEQDKNFTNNKVKNFENSKKFNFQINEVLVEKTQDDFTSNRVTSFILINRWVGIDSLINVSNSNNLSFELFFSAFKEKKKKLGNSFYETNFNLEYKKPSFNFNNTYVKGNTLPGLITFLYYTGSIFFLLISTFIIVVIFIYLEKKIYVISNKNIVYVAFFSHYIVNRIFSFGYAPRDTYLFILSILLSVLFIYILETNRFDKILSNLK